MRRLRARHRWPARLVAAGVVTATVVVACKYQAPATPSDGDVEEDAPPILPDAGCSTASKECFSDGSGNEVLRTCSGAGADPDIEPCSWGCVTEGGAHCGELVPSGGAVLPEHVLPVTGQTLLDITLNVDPITIDTVTGEISGGVRSAGSGVRDGIEFIVRNNVGIFRFKSLTISDDVVIRGANGIALVALETITVDNDINLLDCSNTQRAQGGFVGGAGNVAGGGPNNGNGGEGGVGGNNDSSGGGGGAHAGNGGSGGGGNNEGRSDGGTVFGDERITILRGGAGGGGGGNNGGRGGNGGGAIQLVANGAIAFSTNGSINAGGCGGQAGQDQRAAGGGGAGGAILVEGLTLTMASGAVLAANGGGGGGGDDASTNGGNGDDGETRATGGTGGGSGGNGGLGGAGTSLAGGNGDTDRNGGGGGGGVGWIRLHTQSGTAALDPATIISPTLGEGSPASQGPATVQ